VSFRTVLGSGLPNTSPSAINYRLFGFVPIALQKIHD
jgi:hypothetical protein